MVIYDTLTRIVKLGNKERVKRGDGADAPRLLSS